MKKIYTIILSAISLGMGMTSPLPKASNMLWYNRPAGSLNVEKLSDVKFELDDKERPKALAENEALPIGNGRMGAMIYGGIDKEWLVLNENSLWSGGPNPGGGYFDNGPEAGVNGFGSYQPLGDLVIDFDNKGETTDYIHSLDLDTAIDTVEYSQGGTKFRRETFASTPAQVIVMRLTTDKAGALSATFGLKSQHGAKVVAGGSSLKMSNTLKNGQNYVAGVTLVPEGGTVKAVGDTLELKGATACTVYIAMATDYIMDFKKNWKGRNPNALIGQKLNSARTKPYETLKAEHIAQYKSLFDRVALDLGVTEEQFAQLPIPERLKAYKQNKKDPDLEETLFQYGRYLIISSSRPNSLPANLQGLWNSSTHPAWNSDYHSNINFQMNYWGAEVANLPEMHKSMVNYFSGMAEPARQATKANFKNTDGSPVEGWTVRTSQNPWGGLGWDWNIPGSAWYAAHIWDHYLFNQDKNYLAKQAYPMMKEISQFWEGHLKELGAGGEGFFTSDNSLSPEQIKEELKDIKKGTLVAPNGWSPEHGPREDGIMHDQQLIRELFTNTIAAANILGVDRDWARSLEKKRDLLAPNKIGKEGNLQEWMIDRIAKTDHRHTSHLYAVYPGSEISMLKTPELAEAARKSLEWRGTSGDSVREWAWCWRTALWARFHEGDRAHAMIEGLLSESTLPNLLGNHPPMQMDGSFGITGTMSEMLLQSHAGEIALLPAPTKAWPSGSVKGLKARGNITVDFEWKDGKVTHYTLHSPTLKPVKVNVNGEVKTEMPKLLEKLSR